MPSGYIRVPSGFLFRLRCSPAPPPAPLPRFRVPPLRVPFAVRRDGDADVRLPRDRDVRETSPSDIWQQHLARTCSGKYVAPRTGGRGGGEGKRDRGERMRRGNNKGRSVDSAGIERVMISAFCSEVMSAPMSAAI